MLRFVLRSSSSFSSSCLPPPSSSQLIALSSSINAASFSSSASAASCSVSALLLLRCFETGAFPLPLSLSPSHTLSLSALPLPISRSLTLLCSHELARGSPSHSPSHSLTLFGDCFLRLWLCSSDWCAASASFRSTAVRVLVACWSQLAPHSFVRGLASCGAHASKCGSRFKGVSLCSSPSPSSRGSPSFSVPCPLRLLGLRLLHASIHLQARLASSWLSLLFRASFLPSFLPPSLPSSLPPFLPPSLPSFLPLSASPSSVFLLWFLFVVVGVSRCCFFFFLGVFFFFFLVCWSVVCQFIRDGTAALLLGVVAEHDSWTCA